MVSSMDIFWLKRNPGHFSLALQAQQLYKGPGHRMRMYEIREILGQGRAARVYTQIELENKKSNIRSEKHQGSARKFFDSC